MGQKAVTRWIADKYNIDMILSVLTLFEFCHMINDSFTLSLIADNDPSRDGATAIATGDESSEGYYFFPALVRVEHPTDVWQSSGPGQYQCGWCLQCSKEGQYLTPRFLHVLLLRLAFSFAVAPDTSQQDKVSLVLRRRCAIWKNGIFWGNRSGVEVIVEVVEWSRAVTLLMHCPEYKAMACIHLRSSLIHMILNCLKEFCPTIDTNEFLIDPNHLSNFPLAATKYLTMYSMTEVIRAIQECDSYALDQTGKKILDLKCALHFEPYLGLERKVLDCFFNTDHEDDEIDNVFLLDLAAGLSKSCDSPEIVRTLLNISQSPLSITRFHDDEPIEVYLRLFLTWKAAHPSSSTYRNLRFELNKYSLFQGRNLWVCDCTIMLCHLTIHQTQVCSLALSCMYS